MKELRGSTKFLIKEYNADTNQLKPLFKLTTVNILFLYRIYFLYQNLSDLPYLHSYLKKIISSLYIFLLLLLQQMVLMVI